MIKRWILLINIGLVLAACGGSNTKTNTPPPQIAPSVTPSGETEGTDGRPVENFDISNIPMPRGIIAKDNLTVLASSYFVKADTLYVGLLVRNDNDAPIRLIRVALSTIDADNLRLHDYNLISAFNSIPSGQVVALQGTFSASEYYDGISALVLAEFEATPYIAYHDAQTTAELDSTTGLLSGTALNTSSTPQPLQVAYFILYGEGREELLAVIPAQPVSGLAQGIWQPGVALNYEATVTAVAGDDLRAVKAVSLMVAGYSLTSAN